MTDPTPRWKYRFANYRRALALLREAIDKMEEVGLTQLEQEGAVQRFEYTVELGWNVMKDLLEHEGAALLRKTPVVAIRTAFESDLIQDGGVWMEALHDRNRMSHVYDFDDFREVLEAIRERYLEAMEAFAESLALRELDDG